MPLSRGANVLKGPSGCWGRRCTGADSLNEKGLQNTGPVVAHRWGKVVRFGTCQAGLMVGCGVMGDVEGGSEDDGSLTSALLDYSLCPWSSYCLWPRLLIYKMRIMMKNQHLPNCGDAVK